MPRHYLKQPLGTNLTEISSKMHKFSVRKIHLKMLFAKWLPVHLSPSVLTRQIIRYGLMFQLLWCQFLICVCITVHVRPQGIFLANAVHLMKYVHKFVVVCSGVIIVLPLLINVTNIQVQLSWTIWVTLITVKPQQATTTMIICCAGFTENIKREDRIAKSKTYVQ